MVEQVQGTVEEYGPFDTYKEVLTNRGIYGVQPGLKLVLAPGQPAQFVVAETDEADEGEVDVVEPINTTEPDLPVHSDSEQFDGVDSEDEDVYSLEDFEE